MTAPMSRPAPGFLPPRPTGQGPITQLGTNQALRSNLANKKKEVGLLPPPEYFKKKRAPLKNINLAQWKAQSVLKWLPPKERVEEPKFEELDDFTSLLTRKLYEQLEETEAPGTYAVKDGQYSLIVHTDRDKRKIDDPLSAGAERKNRNLEEMLPGPCFGVLSRLEERRSAFNREEILQFEMLYKDILYDTYIRVGRYYQVYIPEVKRSRAFLKTKVLYGVPPKSQLPIQPPKVYVDFKQKGRNIVTKPPEIQLPAPNNHSASVPAVPHKEFLVPPHLAEAANLSKQNGAMQEEDLDQGSGHYATHVPAPLDQDPNHQEVMMIRESPEGQMLQEDLQAAQQGENTAEGRMLLEQTDGNGEDRNDPADSTTAPGPYGKASSYKHHDDFEGEPTYEYIYTPKRVLQDYLEWDPALVTDPEIIDMVGQVMKEFANEPRVTKEVLFDYLKLCKLNKERFLDHLELDHEDFRKYLLVMTHKAV